MDEEPVYCNGEGASFPAEDFGIRDGLLVHLKAAAHHTLAGDPISFDDVPTPLGTPPRQTMGEV